MSELRRMSRLTEFSVLRLKVDRSVERPKVDRSIERPKIVSGLGV